MTDIQELEQQDEEIEINFRLDGDGRTTSNESTVFEIPHYEPRSMSVSFVENSNGDESILLDELLLDCEIADSGLMPRTFWIGCNDTPQFALEQMALDILHHHCGTTTTTSSSLSDTTGRMIAGAEWWVQIRPSPDKVGRYAMQNMTEENGITFHWDKDEDLRILCGGNTYIHPHLSTVTYLTQLGAPTLVTNTRIHSLSGEWMLPDTPQTWISWPRRWKHFSFDGRYLHAAPMDLMPEHMWEEQLQNHLNPECKSSIRKHRRVTFLVNIWLHYKPFNVHRFPMADKMSGYGKMKKKTSLITFGPSLDHFRSIPMNDEKESTRFTWTMGGGDCNEVIHMTLPLQAIHQEAKDGGSVQVSYQDTKSGVLLEKSEFNEQDTNPEEQDQVSLPLTKRTKTNEETTS